MTARERAFEGIRRAVAELPADEQRARLERSTTGALAGLTERPTLSRNDLLGRLDQLFRDDDDER